MKVITSEKGWYLQNSSPLLDPTPNPEFKARIGLQGAGRAFESRHVADQTPRASSKRMNWVYSPSTMSRLTDRSCSKSGSLSQGRAPTRRSPDKTHLRWNDASDADRSKLLLTVPKKVIAEVIGAKVRAHVPPKRQFAVRRPSAADRGA